MRSVVVYELLSLDGVAEDPDGFITDWDDVMQENLLRVTATQDTVILGRRTHDDWAAFWPTGYEANEPFASFINGVEKLVATSSAPPAFANTTIIDTDLPRYVARLKQQAGGDIGVHGSISLTQSLFNAGLVDRLRLVIAPAVYPHGRKLFDGTPPCRLSLTRHRASPTGYVLVDYDVAG